MHRLNPTAFVFWGITTCIGYLSTGTIIGAVYGLLTGLVISFIADNFL